MDNVTSSNRKYALHSHAGGGVRQKIAKIGLIIIAFGCFVLLVMPYLPRLKFMFFRPHVNAQPYQQAVKNGGVLDSSVTEKGNRLVLPSIGVDAQIMESKYISVISKNEGVWHETANQTPEKPGNIVIAGHSFLYRTTVIGALFYNLTQVHNGDTIYVAWNKKVYEYVVYNTRTVIPTQVDIRNIDPKVEYKLTLYTCTPLGSTAKRFVVEAKMVSSY